MRNYSLDLSKESPLNPLENKESNSVINSRGEEVSNSQGSLCKNFHELRMGVSRGRPKKKHRIGNNPFDFKLNSRLRGKSQNKRASKVKQRLRDFNSKVSDDVRVNSNSKQKSYVKVASEVIDVAINMGLDVVGGRSEGIAFLVNKLEAGVV